MCFSIESNRSIYFRHCRFDEFAHTAKIPNKLKPWHVIDSPKQKPKENTTRTHIQNTKKTTLNFLWVIGKYVDSLIENLISIRRRTQIQLNENLILKF